MPERSVEQVEDQLREDPVDREHERRQDRDRDEDDDRVGDELLAGRPVDLLQLETDLTEELANAGALALLLLRRTAGRGGGGASGRGPRVGRGARRRACASPAAPHGGSWRAVLRGDRRRTPSGVVRPSPARA